MILDNINKIEKNYKKGFIFSQNVLYLKIVKKMSERG